MKMLISTLAVLGFVNIGSATETALEKTQVAAKTATRAVKKGIHRTAESVCGTLTGDNKVQCLAKEVKNRVKEGKDSVVDKASELKNSIDTENN